MPLCDKCGNLVSEQDIIPICVARQTMSEPAEYQEWCRDCVPPDAERLAYERANRIWGERHGGEL
jgi:hypothetical protein